MGKKTTFILILLIVAVDLFVFLPAMRGEFVWDDISLVAENAELQGAAFLKRVLRLPYGETQEAARPQSAPVSRNSFYRPGTLLSFWLDVKIWGLNPSGFHLTNILLHMINSLLLLSILLQLRWGRLTAFGAALLFSVFPLHFENVAWISGRTDLLSFLFVALALLCLVRVPERGGFGWILLGAVFFLAALLSKENALFAGAVMAVLLGRKCRSAGDWMRRMTPLLSAVAVWIALRLQAAGLFSPEISGRILGRFVSAIGFYVVRTVWPFGIGVSVNSDFVFRNPLYLILGGLGIVLLFLAPVILWFRMRKPSAMWFLLSYGLLLLPSALVVFSPAALSLLAWRFLYLPSAVFVSALAFFGGRIFRRPVVSSILLCILAVAYTAEIYPKNRLFGSSEAGFWTGIRGVERESWLVQCNIGAAHLARNDEREALEIFHRLLSRKDPPVGGFFAERIYGNLADYYLHKGDLESAARNFTKLLEVNPNPGLQLSFRYARFLAECGREDEAERIAEKWLGAFPRNHAVLLEAARFYGRIRRFQRCEDLLRRDLELFGSSATRALLEKIRENAPPDGDADPGRRN